MDEPTLPGMPPDPPTKTTKTKTGWMVYRIRSGRLCDRCCRDIHELGAWVAAYPRVARWRVSDGFVTDRLCEAHRDELING